MKEKSSENLDQIDFDDLISESVENAVSRRKKNVELEDDLVELSNEDMKNIKGGLEFPIILGLFFE
ncbi:hypothetical protein [Crocosphaera chwakensis]|uniref:Uncharacterized protein n=1 Tax=Crocosphaera chwakensis CCY0110 TaxID=391612 RepID=A3IKS1_9CHRO|nr:hypothetical protein [Crocosphaera chwakensis]EAZ92790.1 hypothetical protein CY0110_21877 [Crocosphaera chwakensis CCY0110]